MKYLFVLGRDQILSITEILVYLKNRNIEFELKEKETDSILIKAEKLPLNKLIHDLGGTTKIIEILFEGETFNEIAEQIEKKELFEWMNEKFSYSMNFYGKEINKKETIEEFFKNKFKQLKKKAFYRKPKKHKIKGFNSSPTQVYSWDLIEEKSDFVFFKSDKIYFGVTVECFNPKELRKRDNGRPAQSKISAVSLRLARILINLSGAKENQVLLDPFCGIGSVSQEAMFNGINTIGIELNEETAGMARKNLEWFEKTYKTGKTWKIIQGDSSFVKETLQGKKFDAIASEPYLGPYLKKKPVEREARKIIEDLTKLYSAFFRKLSLIINNQKIAIILPEIKCSNGKSIPLTEKVFSNYFKSVNPIKEINEKAFPYNYMEKESNLSRKIYLLEKIQ